jgi:simple sugar transport system substrate-binding protein
MRKVAPTRSCRRHAPVGRLLQQRTQAVLDGTWKSGNVWGGVKEGMIRVGCFGPRCPRRCRTKCCARQKDIAAGKLQPFAGPIATTKARRLAKGQA